MIFARREFELPQKCPVCSTHTTETLPDRAPDIAGAVQFRFGSAMEYSIVTEPIDIRLKAAHSGGLKI